jgi:uncharacterized protein YndB with AHSA1/START domain
MMNAELDLIFERIVDLTPEQMWNAWTTPEQIVHWFCPAPWKTIECKIDLRPGGIFHTTMLSPEGQTFPMNGCILEIIKNRKLVWTDSLVADFRPSETPFMTGVLTFEPHADGTKYKAHVMHANVKARKKHEAMEFHKGWGIALDQMVEYVKGL